MKKLDLGKTSGGSRAAGIAMMACCLAMVAGVVIAVSFADSEALGWAPLLLPLALCGAMHLVLHRFMGQSCHGAKRGDTEMPATDGSQPASGEAGMARPVQASAATTSETMPR